MLLRFVCPHCSCRLSARSNQFHSVAECPDCGGQFMVPAPDDIKLPSETLKFVCPACRRKLSATADQFGTSMPCPFEDCGELIHVPDPERKEVEELGSAPGGE